MQHCVRGCHIRAWRVGQPAVLWRCADTAPVVNVWRGCHRVCCDYLINSWFVTCRSVVADVGPVRTHLSPFFNTWRVLCHV
jgi:hypothetical protein